MINELLGSIVSTAALKCGYENTMTVIKSNRPDLCDYQCDSVFSLAKASNKNPIELGEEITKEINSMDNFDDYFKLVEFAKPGFINMTLSDKFINEFIVKMNSDKFNLSIVKKPNTYVIDYGGYNIAKPLHIGHLRPTIIGEAIKRIINYKGHKTISDVHLGDFGLQIGQVIYGLKRDDIAANEITLEDLNRLYPEISSLCKENAETQKECEQITKELQEGNEEYTLIWKKIMEVSLLEIKEICNYLNVSFDFWLGESDAYKYLDDVEKILQMKKLLVESEGALVVHVKRDTDKKEMPPMLFKKSNGAYLYASTDLATIYERKNKFNPDHIIYVTDIRQNIHFEQVFRASDLAGLISYDKLEHAPNGTTNGTDGKPFKTRKGDAPKLRELFDMVKEAFIDLKEENKDMATDDINIIVNAIVKFADLQNAREKDYIFDIDKFAQVVGKTGPYILYTYLRTNKVIKDLGIKTSKLGNKIYNDVDRELRLKLLELENSFELSFTSRKPHYVAEYIYELCVAANNFYQINHLSSLNDKENLNDWIYLLTLTNKVIKEMLSLLAIDIPTAM